MTDKRPPTCATCVHGWMPRFMGAEPSCQRRTSWDAVHGDRIDGRSAAGERGRLGVWLGRDICGPAGRYWQQRPPLVPPTAGTGVRKPRPAR